MEGNLRFKIDWARLIVGSKFTVLALFYFVFEGNFRSTSHRGTYIWRGDLTEGFVRYRFRRLIFGGAYTWRGLFSEFYSICFCFHFYGKVTFSRILTTSVLINVRYVVLLFWQKERKNPLIFDFNSSSYGYFFMALSYFIELSSRMVYRLT